MSTISKFGFSSDNKNSVGVVGPRGPAGAKGEQGEQGPPGADAVFPLALNYADISGIASLTGPPDANSTMYINSNMDFNGYNSLYNVSSISAYDAIGQPLTITGSLQVNGSVQISQNFVNTTLTANKFLKTDEGKTVTSTDIQINDVKDLSTRLLLNESNTRNISVTSTGDAFTAPNQGASLIHTTSTNPTFKIKGLTSSNSIFLNTIH